MEKDMAPSTRHPAFSGSFYPSDPNELTALIAALLESRPEKKPEKRKIRAIMVPHAGYSYSGDVAAVAYNALSNCTVQTIFLIGNAHSALFEGIALDENETWTSPLGNVPVNTALVRKLHERYPEFVQLSKRAHLSDHILEVQLPFLQHSLEPGFSIVPLLFGNNPPEIYDTCATILSSVLQTGDLVIASTDLSHYPSFHNANVVDSRTLEYIARKDINGLEKHVQRTLMQNIPREETLFCGPDTIKTLLQLAKRFGWTTEVLCYANSGNKSFGDRETVVGYGSVAFFDVFT